MNIRMECCDWKYQKVDSHRMGGDKGTKRFFLKEVQNAFFRFVPRQFELRLL